ncbi:MAG: L,D-transpeptidase [Clostridium sp.]|nr:L,D-transpeptidase [Clostridium sp.]
MYIALLGGIIMARNYRLTFHSNSAHTGKSYFALFTKIILLAIVSLLLFEFYSYKVLLKNFKANFNEHNFSNANILLISDNNFNPFKSLYLKKDLTNYFNEKLEELSLNTQDINEQSIINILNEINRYSNYVDIDNSLLSKSSADYSNGVYLFNCQKYIQAYNIFSKIKSTNENYASCIEYIKKCKENIINEVLSESTTLCNEECYSEALDLLDSVNYIVGDNENIISKIEEIKVYEADFSYNDETKQASSNNVNSKISTSNINTLSISSNTKYLIHVDLKNQRTNIYKGSKNLWKLLKSFTCSSGTTAEETPTGVYTIKERGKWFFSNSYNQGGKYWVQFYGDYLFHSLPFDKTETNIVDYTLGKPASHGCIRLRENDSKWIYDNVPKDSKVIIQ